jgi:glutamine amidotransferase-like uncharacterized protein
MIYIYAGPGTTKDNLKHTTIALDPFLKSYYRIEHIFPEQLINDHWEANTALLIIPGGADIPYTKALNGKGNQKIRTYVEKGGAFLGICAGSYYGGEFVDFAKGATIEVQGKRELSFFPGIVRGPVLAPYDYRTKIGARAAKIHWSDHLGFQNKSVFTVFYNGGGYFVDAKTKKQTNILASYDVEEEFAAIVECQIGRGKVILSGVHFEYDPFLLDDTDDYLQQIIPSLKNENGKRIQLLQHLLERLNL